MLDSTPLARPARLIAAFAVSVLALTGHARAEDAAASDAEKNFLAWASIASAQTSSAATAEPGDYARTWKAPDGRTIKLVVKLPRPRADAPAVTVSAVADGDDARPAFEAAVAQAKAQRASRLIIPKGTYTFKTIGKGAPGHWYLQGLSDITVEGTGATLIFTQNQPGILISQSQRLRIAGLTVDYSLHTASIATVESRDGQNVLVIDPKYPVTGNDSVYYASEYDPKAHLWVQGGLRAIMPPGFPSPAVFAGDQTYTSAVFRAIKTGRSYVVFHHWYGGPAIKIDDSPGPNQAEDVVMDGVTVRSSPGMGILTYGLKRGLAIVNSTIAPRPDNSSPVSAEYDAIHVVLGGGDLLIENNQISGQGDDDINLNNPVHPIVSISDEGKTMVLSTYARFISAGDTLAFFDNKGAFLGQAGVVGKPKGLGGLNYQVTLDRPTPPSLDLHGVVRDLALITSRFEVSGNTIQACNCHGLLVQLPNGRVQGNTFRNLNYTEL